MAIMKNKNNSNYYNKLGGVGLGIVVALDKPNSTAAAGNTGEVLIKYAVVGAPPSPRSDPIQMIRPDNRSGNNKRGICIPDDQDEEEEDDDDDDDENFTYVTCRGPTNSMITRVYHHKPEDKDSLSRRRTRKAPVLNMEEDPEKHTWSDFLQSCNLCRKPLLGKDIYMYRGEKAFCSEECRQRQIASDERKEKFCRAEASTSSSSEMVSRSPCYYEPGQIFSTGIIAI